MAGLGVPIFRVFTVRSYAVFRVNRNVVLIELNENGHLTNFS